MTDSNQAGLEKLNEASQYREKCEKRAQKVKRLRNIIAVFFALSIGVVITLNFVAESAVASKIRAFNFLESMPTTEFVAFVLALISLILLIISVFKSIAVELQAHNARKAEGYLAQRLFRVVLHSKNKELF